MLNLYFIYLLNILFLDYKYKTIINNTNLFVKNYMKNYDISHNYEHVNNVVILSKFIAEKENIYNITDLFHIEMGALLHDIGDSKYIMSNTTQFNIINNYLNSIPNLTNYDKNQIIQISCNVSLSKEHTFTYNYKHIKLYIVQDADRINSLGSVGIFRYILFNKIKKNNINFNNIINDIITRTNKLILFIKTKTGKILSLYHLKLINDFIYNYKNFNNFHLYNNILCLIK